MASVSNLIALVDICSELFKNTESVFSEQNSITKNLTKTLNYMVDTTTVSEVDMVLHAVDDDFMPQWLVGFQTLLIRGRDVLLLVVDCITNSANDLSPLDSTVDVLLANQSLR